MTRKHYQATAEAIAKALDECPSDASIAIVERMAERMAEMFAADNPRFDRNRFMQACGCVMD